MSERAWVFDENAVSEVFGYIILIAVVITTIGIIFVESMPDILHSQNKAQFQNVEQAFTVLDSHAKKSQYSNYLSQMTEMDLEGGSISVNDSSNDSYIAINFLDGTQIYNGTLGTIRYSIDGEEIGYQGGGLWEKYADSGSVMVSAPDFNFNGVTLTLPLTQLNGNGGAAGSGKAYVITKSQSMPITIYPNLTLSPNATNPVTASQVYVKIRSDYYVAWANYINKRTEAAAVPYPNNKTVIVTFNTQPNGMMQQPFKLPISFRGVNTSEDHPINTFNLNLSESGNGQKIHDLNFDIRAPSENSVTTGPTSPPALHINVQAKGGKNIVNIQVEYADKNGVESFTSDVNAIIGPADIANFSLLDYTAGTTYTSKTPSWTWGTTTYDSNGPGPSLGDVIQHYVVLLAQNYPTGFSLCDGNLHGDHNQNSGGGNQYPDPPSTYTLDYDAINVLTYMHITNSPIDVTIS